MRFRFAGFQADAARLALERDGEPVAIEPKPLRLLLHLLARHPAIVPKEELLQALWPAEEVTADSLTRAVRGARRALEELGSEAVLIRNVRGHGYGIGVEVECVDEAPQSACAPARDAFVGREDVLTALREALASARAGQGRVALLVGEPGIGKTRTAEELSSEARAAGAEVVWGRAPESPGAPAFWPWLQVLRSLVRGRNPARLRAELGPGARDVAAVVPEVRERLPKLASPQHLPPGQARFRFFDALAHFLVRASAERPLVLVLDDLHWADATSLQLLTFVAQELAEARILLLGTHRHVGAPPNEALDATLAELARLPAALPPLLLSGLSLGEVQRLLFGIQGTAADATRTRTIHARTDGNPFFVRELVRLAESHPGVGTPGISAVVRKRLDSVGEETHELLEAASVLGREVPVQLLEHLLGARRGVVWDRLEEAERAGFLEEMGEAETPTFRFVHAVLYETLYAHVPRRKCMELHQRAGEALEMLHRLDLEPHVAALAHHFGKAARLGELRRAAAYTELAARQARAHFAFEEAGRGYARALELAGKGGDDAWRCDLLLDLGEARTLAGSREDARAAFRQAAGLARARADGERLARAALGFANASEDILFADPEALALLEEALEVMGEGAAPLRIAVLGRLATLLLAVGQTSEDRAWTLADQMVQEARGSPDPSTRAGALLDRLTVLQLRPLDWPAEQRMEAAIAALEAAEEAGRDDLVLLARRQRIPLALELGDATLLDADIQRFASESDRVRIRSQRHHAASYLAMRALQTGRFDDARVWIDAAETLADPSDPREAVFTPLTQRLLLPCTPESDRAIETSLLRCIEVLPLPHWSTALARFYFDTGREEDAAAVVNRLLAEGFPKGLDRNIGWLVAVAAVAHVCAGLDWRAPSAAFFELLEPFSQYNIAIGFGIGCMGPVSYYLGDLAVTAGQYAKATCHLESALAMTERMNARPWEAVVRLARARLFLHRGEPGDARAERDTALKLADGLGLDELRARGDALLS